jgi:hypothetical protein
MLRLGADMGTGAQLVLEILALLTSTTTTAILILLLRTPAQHADQPDAPLRSFPIAPLWGVLLFAVVGIGLAFTRVGLSPFALSFLLLNGVALYVGSRWLQVAQLPASERGGDWDRNFLPVKVWLVSALLVLAGIWTQVLRIFLFLCHLEA